MVMAADLSMRRGDISAADLRRVIELLSRANLPTKAPKDMTSEQFIELMGVDKKVLDGRLRLVLLMSLGRATVTSDIDKSLLLQTFSACR
jgi:3-dehydroquinate synthase